MRFLLLDDEKVSRFTLRQMVQSIPGATIHEAGDAVQAREQLALLPAPAVCIFDVRMPGENGLDLLAWVRTQPRYMAWPVLLFTGNEDDLTRQQASKLGVDGYLPKPPEPGSAAQVSALAARFAEDLLPEPRALAQRLGTSTGHLMSYLDALEKQITELGKAADDASRQTIHTRCLQVGKALGSRHLVQALQQWQDAEAAIRPEWLRATELVVEGMRERFALAS